MPARLSYASSPESDAEPDVIMPTSKQLTINRYTGSPPDNHSPHHSPDRRMTRANSDPSLNTSGENLQYNNHGVPVHAGPPPYNSINISPHKNNNHVSTLNYFFAVQSIGPECWEPRNLVPQNLNIL